MTEKFENRLDFAKYLAIQAGNLARDLYKDRDRNFVAEKGLQDFVTIADRKVEERIRALISQHFPDDAVLGEEEGRSGASDALWVVDPIDGTANYMRGLPDWAVSIAFCEKDEIELGVIYAPDRDQLCWAGKGTGAFCNDQAVRVSECCRANQALLLLGRSSRRPVQDYLDIVERTINSQMEYRRNGSAAVSLMSVALGHAEGYYEAHLNAWDALAGILMIQEAGGRVHCSPIDETVENGTKILACVPGLEDVISDGIVSGY